MGRHAYLIIAHSNFSQLKTLLGLLDDERNDVFVHVDARAANFDEAVFDGACSKSALQFLKPRIAVHWGGVSIMRAEIALLKAAVAKGGYDYYHLLSGMDLPIKSQDEIHSFFDANKGCEFLNMWEFKKSTFSRFHYYTLFPEGAGSFWPNLGNNIFKGLQMAVGAKYNKDVTFAFASQWFSITEDFAKYVIGSEGWLEKVFAHTNTCDEIFLATLLVNSPFKDRLYDATVYPANTGSHANMRFIDWTRGESVRHPWTFREDDLEALLKREELFARKFDERVDKRIIELLEQQIRQK